ncbi:MAG: extracellular solute-binding protein [Actinomycetota bacterium]
MFKNKLWLLFFILFLILALASLFSCRLIETGEEISEEKTVEENEDVTETEVIIESEKQLDIEIWDYMGAKERIALMDSIEKFNNLNPDLNLEARHIRSEQELIDQYKAASLAGSGPEIVLINMVNMHDLAEANVTKDIDFLDYENFIGGMEEVSSYNENYYIIPFRATDFLVFFYNRNHVNNAPEDFEEVVEYCIENNNAEEQTYGFILNGTEPDWVIPFLGGYSGWIVDYNNYAISLDTSSMEKTLNFLDYLYNSEDNIMPSDLSYEEINSMFKNGNLHMVINSIQVIEEYKEENIYFNTSVIPEVYEGSKNPTPIIEGMGFMVNANCFGQELEASKNFINFMLSEDIQLEWNKNTATFPVNKNISENEEFQNSTILYNAFEQAKLCRGDLPEEVLRAIRDSLRINVEKFLEGDLGIEDAVQKIEEDAIRLRSGTITIEELREESLQ